MDSPATSLQNEHAGLAGDWGGLRPAWEARGIFPHILFIGEVMVNVAGGYDHGAASVGLAEFSFDLDLEKLAGWKGGGFTICTFSALAADGSAKYIGDFNVASNIYTPTNFNIFNLFFSQTLSDEQVFIKAGQITVDDDFMSTSGADLFINSAFGAMAVESGNLAAPIYPLAAPGAFIRVSPTGGFYAQAAIYAGDAGPVRSSNHGFEWRTGGATGWVTFAETGYDYGCGAAKVGGYWHSGEFENYRNGKTERGLGAVYGTVSHRFVEAGAGSPGLSAFFRAAFATEEEHAVVSKNFDAGVVLNGVFLPEDALGLGVTTTIFGDDYRRATSSPTAETILELTYEFQVAESWMIQPDIQYIINPHASRSDALIMGVRTEMEF